MYDLWANYSPEAVKAADEVLTLLGHDKNVLGAEVENELHRHLADQQGLDPMGDDIFRISDEAMEVAELMLGLPKGTL